MNRIILLIAIACGIASAVLCWNVLGLIPHASDELSYSYQGRILASARLWVEEPAIPEAFTVSWDHILRDSGRWRSIYPPGWPLLMAAGWLIGAPWLINPLLLCCSIIGVFQLAKQLFDERTAIFAVVAFACSPFVLFMSAGFMSHQSALCFAVWCAFFLTRGESKDYVLAGASGSFTFLIRPFTTVAILLPFLLWSLWKSQNKKKAVLQLVSGAFPFLLLFLFYNSLLFGSIFHTGYSFDPDVSFRGSLVHHFNWNVPWYFSNLNGSLWGWPWPDLLIFVPLFIPHRKWKMDVVLVVCFLSLLFAYSVYYYKDIVYGGPRYVYEAVGFLAILAARSIRLLEETIQRRTVLKFGPALLLLFVYPLFVTLPVQMDYHSQAYHGQSKELLDLVESRSVGRNALVLISGDPHVFRTFYLENSLDPAESERVFARDLPGMREAIVQAYQRVEIWSMRIELILLKGRNQYGDRAVIRSVQFHRIR